MSDSNAQADLVAEGRQLLRVRKFPEAAERFTAAIAANPHDYRAHEAMATVAFVTKDFEAAAKYFREASRCDASRPEPLINLGAVLNKLQRYKEAIEVLQKGLGRNRSSAEAYYNLGIAYRGSGDSSMAVSAYREAIRLKSDFAEAYQNLGNAYLDVNNKRQATTAFTRALELNPELGGAKRGLQKAAAVAPAPLPVQGTPRRQNFESGVTAPPVVLTDVQRAADREIVNEAARRVERSVMALSSELSSDLEPALKKLAKSIVDDSPAVAAESSKRLADAIYNMEQILKLVAEANSLLVDHENDLTQQTQG